MQISLRPHHLLCLQGYRGANYNKSQIIHWDLVSRLLKEYPHTDILILNGKDDLCAKCPAAQIGENKKILCLDKNVNDLDNKVQELLGLVSGKTYKYGALIKDLNKNMTRQTHEKWCSLCMWWKKGLCRDSF